VVALALVIAAQARAGQLRVNVASNSFSPQSIQPNNGDHIIWVWSGDFHTVTSGNGSPTGIFASGLRSTGASFTWKIDRTGLVPYYCEPHFAFNMTGNMSITASGNAVSDFRITEVFFNAPNGEDFIEITNLGDAPGNLGRYRLSLVAATVFTFTLANINVPVGGRFVVWVNRSGIDTQTELFNVAHPELARTGSAALYAPNTVNANLGLPDQMIDFVQWGDMGQANATTASTASLWNGSDFVEAPAVPHSIEFCGNATNRGPTFWAPRLAATPGTADCMTPTRSATWGRIKTLYR